MPKHVTQLEGDLIAGWLAAQLPQSVIRVVWIGFVLCLSVWFHHVANPWGLTIDPAPVRPTPGFIFTVRSAPWHYSNLCVSRNRFGTRLNSAGGSSSLPSLAVGSSLPLQLLFGLVPFQFFMAGCP